MSVQSRLLAWMIAEDKDKSGKRVKNAEGTNSAVNFDQPTLGVTDHLGYQCNLDILCASHSQKQELRQMIDNCF